jgi:hypothetical protein
MPITNKKVIKAYFKANSTTKKFCNMPPAFLKVTLQALDLINKENKNKNKKEVNKAFKLKSALSFIKYS